jgi:hypothetical protein
MSPEKDDDAVELTEGFTSGLEGFDLGEVLRRMLKYFVEGVAVGVVAYYLAPKSKGKDNKEYVLLIAVTAAATFAILDMYTPSISSAARTGAGFGIGANLTGFPR